MLLRSLRLVPILHRNFLHCTITLLVQRLYSQQGRCLELPLFKRLHRLCSDIDYNCSFCVHLKMQAWYVINCPEITSSRCFQTQSSVGSILTFTSALKSQNFTVFKLLLKMHYIRKKPQTSC